jgi:nitrite reductase (NADH) small subunit
MRLAAAMTWVDICALDEIVPGTGVCALLGGRQVAVVRAGDELFAVDNFDPFAEAFVISRGLVGEHAGVPTIASPIFKQRFDLRSGRCLDEPGVALRVWSVRVQAGRVEVLGQ